MPLSPEAQAEIDAARATPKPTLRGVEHTRIVEHVIGRRGGQRRGGRGGRHDRGKQEAGKPTRCPVKSPTHDWSGQSANPATSLRTKPGPR